MSIGKVPLMDLAYTSSPQTAQQPALQAWSEQIMRSNPRPVLLRATLDGLEVSETSFDAWLIAGGDRRCQPRAPTRSSDAAWH